MERTIINIVFESTFNNDRISFALDIQSCRKSHILVSAIHSNTDKKIKYVKVQLNAPINALKHISEYLQIAEEPTLEFKDISDFDCSVHTWEIEWLNAIDDNMLLDTLCIATTMGLDKLAKLLVFYIQSQTHKCNDMDIISRLGIADNIDSESMKETEAIFSKFIIPSQK